MTALTGAVVSRTLVPGAVVARGVVPVARRGGIGPGAHSHVGGVRWWNVRRPAAYAQALAAGRSPAAGREILTAEGREIATTGRSGLYDITITDSGGALVAQFRGRSRTVPNRQKA